MSSAANRGARDSDSWIAGRHVGDHAPARQKV
jgi:hypothetical protein